MNHYCRRCGGKLDNPRRKFHPDCLDADKRERLAAQRQRERSRVQAFHRRQPCPCCGKRIGSHPVPQQAPAPAVDMAREASHSPAVASEAAVTMVTPQPIQAAPPARQCARHPGTLRETCSCRMSESRVLSTLRANPYREALGARGGEVTPQQNVRTSVNSPTRAGAGGRYRRPGSDSADLPRAPAPAAGPAALSPGTRSLSGGS